MKETPSTYSSVQKRFNLEGFLCVRSLSSLRQPQKVKFRAYQRDPGKMGTTGKYERGNRTVSDLWVPESQ